MSFKGASTHTHTHLHLESLMQRCTHLQSHTNTRTFIQTQAKNMIKTIDKVMILQLQFLFRCLHSTRSTMSMWLRKAPTLKKCSLLSLTLLFLNYYWSCWLCSLDIQQTKVHCEHDESILYNKTPSYSMRPLLIFLCFSNNSV